mmetsp:Transcript_4035/g.11880  ORF Transcript_4035/g.11880 Transcript_4035/m.11880 type:complete len:344 (+) Transcript_4035:105-1136(+)
MPRRPRRQLSINVDAKVTGLERSFEESGDVFHRDGMWIDAEGVSMQRENADSDSARPKLVYEDLQIGKVVGQGSSSVVLEATYGSCTIALKVINMFERAKRDQLIREIQSLYNCRCPAIIGFYGAFFREGAISVALEFMNGGSLANVISHAGALPERALAHITFQILYGLTYLKRQKRVHRDIKPSNLLINSNGEVKVTDFGVSAALGNSIAMCGTFVGTFKYMSPERISSTPYSYASDIWSAGLSLLECATGAYPYPEEETCIGMAQTILEAEVPTPPSGASSEFSEFIAHCLDKDPRRRLPAEILLTAPWLQKLSAVSMATSIAALQGWIRDTPRFESPTP